MELLDIITAHRTKPTPGFHCMQTVGIIKEKLLEIVRGSRFICKDIFMKFAQFKQGIVR